MSKSCFGFIKVFSNLVMVVACCSLSIPLSLQAQEEDEKKEEGPASFYRQVRPILLRHCSGCHQPAKMGGKLLLTSYDSFKKGGESGEGFTPGKPDESLILDYISGDEPEMPLNQDPLKKVQVDLIARWIKEGAKDDTPETAKDTITAENPPQYANPPVITALAYSPDSKLLTVSGFHETLMHKADGSGLVSRLVGRAHRIETLQFSPDGTKLAVTGGSPALFGEVQFWDVAKSKLISSTTIGFDTLFGGAFNKDGKLFAFGAGDNRARVLNVKDSKQVMRFDAHSDYVLDTTFSLQNDHLITVSRDMSMKLVIIKSAQFVDNITSITPGALKGGLMAVERHPLSEQVLAGGADGQPKLYKIFRTRKRIIGDDFNQIRSFQKLPGRIFDLEFNKDGSLFVVGSSTATGGAARIYKTGTFDEKTINNKGGLGDVRQQVAKRSAENAMIHELKETGPVYAVAFRPDGKQVAVGGFGGKVRLYNVADGKLVKEFVPVTVMPTVTAAK
jgi:WD40 repeat protein